MKWWMKFLAAVLTVFVLACAVFYLELLFVIGWCLQLNIFKLFLIPIILIFVIIWKLPSWFKL